MRTYNNRVPRVFDWPITPLVKNKFMRLALRLEEIGDENDVEYLELREELRRLPGFPKDARPWDIIEFVNEGPTMSLPSVKPN